MKRMYIYSLLFLIFILSSCQMNQQVQVVFDYGFNNETTFFNIETGEPTIKPIDPIRSGYEFIGWFTDLENEASFDFSTPIIDNITLHAKWRLVRFQYSVHTESYIIDITFDDYTINDNQDMLEIWVRVTFKEDFNISMYTESFGEEGIISLTLLKDSTHLYSQYDGLSFNDSVLDVDIKNGDVLERSYQFSRNYFYGVSDYYPILPTGTYQLQFMMYSIDATWIETPIYITVR